MCGRYVTVTKIKEIEKRFNVTAPDPSLYLPNTNISHGQMAPVITDDKPNELQFFQFGFTPSWGKKNFYMVNARAEGDHNREDDPSYCGAMGIINKPMFRKAIRSQRCLVVADCFIEGPKQEKLNKPYVVYLRDGARPFALAGIWDEWVNTQTGEIVHSFAIITTVANELLQQIGHHRSPVIIPREHEADWLNPDLELAAVLNLLARLRQEHGLTYLLVSHDLAVISHLCSRVAVMQGGRLIEQLPVERLRRGEAATAYTRELIAASRG